VCHVRVLMLVSELTNITSVYKLRSWLLAPNTHATATPIRRYRDNCNFSGQVVSATVACVLLLVEGPM